MRNHLSVLVLVTAMASRVSGAPEQPSPQVQNLKTLSLEELLQIDVTTVSRETERRVDAPAAVSVITGEDIRRYGVDTLADALRLADSVSVARFNGGSWAVATRGFSATTNNKLLVMIDGRSVYTPLFGGVFWEVQHMLLPDLDRIEIIRGPAGTLWGPNAVNGVINIITKRASETQGALVRGVTGSRERAHLAARYGGRINPRTSYRVYGVGSDFASPELQDGSSAGEGRRLRQAGGASTGTLPARRVSPCRAMRTADAWHWQTAPTSGWTAATWSSPIPGRSTPANPFRLSDMSIASIATYRAKAGKTARPTTSKGSTAFD